MRLRLILPFASAGWSAGAGAAEDRARLQRECGRVTEVYPLLMLAVMAEGPLDCREHHDPEPVDCAANETSADRAAHARCLAVRQYQSGWRWFRE